MERYHTLTDHGKQEAATDSFDIVFKALKFAAFRHRFSKTKNEQPYINHVINVSVLLYEVGNIHTVEILTAAILHDVLEKTNTKPIELEKAFGQSVAACVIELTDVGYASENEKWESQLSKIDSLSQGARLIKLADKIENVSSLLAFPPLGWDVERRVIYIEWAEKIINALRGTNIYLELYFDQLITAEKENNPLYNKLT